MKNRLGNAPNWTLRTVGALIIGLSAFAGAPGIRAQQATPLTEPDAPCTVEPRSLDEVNAPAGTPIADFPFDADNPPLFPSLPSEPADAETIAGVTRTLKQWAACINSGTQLQIAALLSDDLLTGTIDPETLDDTTYEVPLDQRYVLLDVVYVRKIADGRVGAIAITGQPRWPGAMGSDFFYFERSGDRWLLDGYPALLPDEAGIPADATPTVPITVGEALGPEACTIPPLDEETYKRRSNAPEAIFNPGDGVLDRLAPVIGPPDDVTLAAVEETARQWIACINAGDPYRYTALFTDAYFKNLDLAFSWSALPDPKPPAEWSAYLGLFRPLLYADGRVGTIVAYDSPHRQAVESIFVVFAPAVDGWRIDILGAQLGQELTIEADEYETYEEVE